MRPVVILPSCSNPVGDAHGQSVLDAYLDAVARGAGALPLVVPSPQVESEGELERLLDLADGVLLTGSPSNIEPRHYAGPSYPGTLHDPPRDAFTLPLVRAAVARGMPLLGICRGLQEMNVALGGTLHQRVHEAGFADHREADGPPDCQYAPAHDVDVVPGGMLHGIVGRVRLRVNSLHWQGIAILAPNCVAEARSPDGLVEAISLRNAAQFALAVQWHPEWCWQDDQSSAALFSAFGEGVRRYRSKARSTRFREWRRGGTRSLSPTASCPEACCVRRVRR